MLSENNYPIYMGNCPQILFNRSHTQKIYKSTQMKSSNEINKKEKKPRRSHSEKMAIPALTAMSIVWNLFEFQTTPRYVKRANCSSAFAFQWRESTDQMISEWSPGYLMWTQYLRALKLVPSKTRLGGILDTHRQQPIAAVVCLRVVSGECGSILAWPNSSYVSFAVPLETLQLLAWRLQWCFPLWKASLPSSQPSTSFFAAFSKDSFAEQLTFASCSESAMPIISGLAEPRASVCVH